MWFSPPLASVSSRIVRIVVFAVVGQRRRAPAASRRVVGQQEGHDNVVAVVLGTMGRFQHHHTASVVVVNGSTRTDHQRWSSFLRLGEKEREFLVAKCKYTVIFTFNKLT